MFSPRRYLTYTIFAAIFLFFFNSLRRDPEAELWAVDRLSSSQWQKAFPLDGNGRVDWSSVIPKFPVRHITPLPIDPPEQLPKVQHDFAPETAKARAVRLKRKASVRDAFDRCWRSYKKHSWAADELAPLSGRPKQTFGGWAATLIDSLDTLWIMGYEEDFDLAVAEIYDIDFSQSSLTTISVFETTIRHLGGMISAYELSDDGRLLRKAEELGHMLLLAFDTPHHMPIPRWRIEDSLKAQEVPQRALSAEIGSFGLEFTRLSQLTGDPKWYDAVVRIARIFDKQQYTSRIPGMWPVSIDIRNLRFNGDTKFTLNSMADSLYEYFPKMHALLGGTEPIWKRLYDGSMDAAMRYTLFKPKLPGNVDVLFSGQATAKSTRDIKLAPEVQHLGCYTGGMYALGGRLFDEPSHVEAGRKLTEGCIWAYQNSARGVMPEVFRVTPCKHNDKCEWDEREWRTKVEDLATGAYAVGNRVSVDRTPPGFTKISDPQYMLRPEAIESVFVLYRITGEPHYADAAWEMFVAIMEATATDLANAALSDVTYSAEELEAGELDVRVDSMESFWMAETLKYFYLIFSEPNVIDLDEWVLTTEAHPFRRPRVI